MIADPSPPLPEDACVINGIAHYREEREEEEAFSSDLLSRHPDCLALLMHEQYVRLYREHGEETAEAFLHEISNSLRVKH